MGEEKKYPRVGIGVIIENGKGEILLSKRLRSHGAGEWSFPGGHLEFGEKIFDGARREVLEETGIDIREFELVSVYDEMRYINSDGKHYINLGVKGKYEGGEPKNLEPEKHSDWQWFSPDSLPENLFEGTEITLKKYKSGKIY